MPPPRNIGPRIAELREAAGLSQAELAARLGTSSAMVSQLETGHRTPSLARLQALAEALGVEPGELLRPAGLTRQRKSNGG